MPSTGFGIISFNSKKLQSSPVHLCVLANGKSTFIVEIASIIVRLRIISRPVASKSQVTGYKHQKHGAMGFAIEFLQRVLISNHGFTEIENLTAELLTLFRKILVFVSLQGSSFVQNVQMKLCFIARRQ